MKSPKLWPAKPLLNERVVSECAPVEGALARALPKSKPEVSGSETVLRSKFGFERSGMAPALRSKMVKSPNGMMSEPTSSGMLFTSVMTSAMA